MPRCIILQNFRMLNVLLLKQRPSQYQVKYKLNVLSVQFCKNFKELSFYGQWVKNLKTFTRPSFQQQLSKKCISEFTAIFFCLLLSCCKLCPMKRNSKLDGLYFQQQLTIICQILRNDQRLLKYLTGRKLKMSAILIFEIKGARKNKIFNFSRAASP